MGKQYNIMTSCDNNLVIYGICLIISVFGIMTE